MFAGKNQTQYPNLLIRKRRKPSVSKAHARTCETFFEPLWQNREKNATVLFWLSEDLRWDRSVFHCRGTHCTSNPSSEPCWYFVTVTFFGREIHIYHTVLNQQKICYDFCDFSVMFQNFQRRKAWIWSEKLGVDRPRNTTEDVVCFSRKFSKIDALYGHQSVFPDRNVLKENEAEFL